MNTTRAKLADLYAIIDGVPEDLVDLAQVATTNNIHKCGALFCGIGIAAAHPTKFKRLSLDFDGGLLLDGRCSPYFWEAAAVEFEMRSTTARCLFGSRKRLEADDAESDKQVLLGRIRQYFIAQGWPVREAA